MRCDTQDSNALIAPSGHDAINNFYDMGGGILVGSGGDNGDGHGEDLYYDFVNAPRGLPFNGDPSALTSLGARFSKPPDCNDTDPSIHPGAPEASGGHVESDCEGVIDPFAVIRPHLSFLVQLGRRFTKFTSLVVPSVRAGATVGISCIGRRRCPFHQQSVKVTRAMARSASRGYCGTQTFGRLGLGRPHHTPPVNRRLRVAGDPQLEAAAQTDSMHEIGQADAAVGLSALQLIDRAGPWPPAGATRSHG